MADIYEHAYFTIAATASPDSEGGCFQTVPLESQDLEFQYTPRARAPFAIRFREAIDHLNNDDPEATKTDWPPIQRAWVFQERALSSRVIHFCKREILIECRKEFKCQCGAESIMDMKKRIWEAFNGRKVGWMSTYPWGDFIREASILNLTYQADKLPAISALERRMPREDGDEYLGGLWKKELPLTLGWFAYPGYDKPSRPPAPRPPSWSWAATESPVSM